MPFYKDSYSTTVGSVMNTQTIVHNLIKAFIKDGLDNTNLGVRSSGDVKPAFVLGTFDSEAEIPLFTHPIMVSDGARGKTLVTDMRYFVKKGTQAWEIEKGVRNLTEFNFTKSRAVLNLLWVSDRVGEIRNGLAFAGVVYAAWLAETIAKNFALDFGDQTKVQIATHFFYQTLFSEKTEFDDEEKQRMVAHTIKATGLKADQVFAVVDKLKPMTGIADLCDQLIDVVENVRLKDLNTAILLTIVRNSWYGTNAKEIIAVSLEHPPTWAAMVFTALTERTFSTSMVYRIADRHGKRGGSAEFLKNYNGLIRDNVVNEKQSRISTEQIHQDLDELSKVTFD